MADFPCDIIALQEVRLTEDGQKIAQEELSNLGWTSLWGKPQPIRRGTYKSVLDAKQGGVGILVRTKHQGTPSPKTQVGEELYNTGRWHSVVVKVNKGGMLLHVVTVYGFPGASDGGEAAFQNESLLRKVFDEASTLGDVPVLVCGDFNTSLESSAVLGEMVASGQWCDGAYTFSAVSETELEHTYSAFGGTSRIDMVFLNKAATRCFQKCQVIPVPEGGIKRHKPVQCDLSLDIGKEFATQIPKVRKLPEGNVALSQDEIAALESTAISAYIDEFSEALEHKDTETMWRSWCHMAEQFLVAKAAGETQKVQLINDHRYYGRGTKVDPKRVRVGRAPDKGGGIGIDPERRELHKLTNILSELQALLPSGNERHLHELWTKARGLGREALKTHPFSKYWSERTRPPAEGVAEVKAQVDSVLMKVSLGDRDRLLRKWRRERLKRAKEGIGDLAKHFRAPDQAPLSVIKLPDGSITGNIEKIDEELRRNWLPIFAKHRHGNTEPPDATTFLNKYAEHIPYQPQTLSEITIDDLLWVQGKLNSSGAGGLDGWRPAEIKRIPMKILSFLKDLFNTIEATGEWPSALCTAGITLIPKGDGGAPLNLRPITVAPIVYRMWAAIRMKHSIPWQESWMTKGQHGARAKHSTVNALARISMVIERAILEGTPIYGITFDLAKAFDNIPIEVTFGVCKAVGMDERLFVGLKGIYDRMRRRFKIDQYVGETFKDTNGILQGCPLSVMLLNILMAVLSNVLTPVVRNESFVDDLTVLSPSALNLQRAADLMNAFMTDTGQKVNLKKTYSFGPNGGADVLFNGDPIPKKAEVKVLGVVWKFAGGRLNLTVDADKIADAIAKANRIRYSQLPFSIRNLLNGSLVMSKVMYGVEVLDLQPGDERRLRTAIGFSIWQKSSKQRSPGLLFTLTTKGHVVDPAQAPHVRRLLAAYRCCKFDPEIREDLVYLWNNLKNRRRYRGGGFIENLLYSAKRLGISSDVSVEKLELTLAGTPLDAFSVSMVKWAHYCREAARLSVWRLIDKERGREGRTLWGLASGVDRTETMNLYMKSDARQQGILRKIILNAVWTQTRRAKMPHTDADPMCPCGMEHETLKHLWWHCPRWNDIRDRHGYTEVNSDTWSPALRDLGVKLNSDDRHDVPDIQNMMVAIFTARFAV